jgi:hypothetical protein
VAEALKVDVKGVDVVTAILLKFSDDLKTFNGFGSEIGKLITNNASAIVPRKTGALAASIGSTVTEYGLQVYAGSTAVPYAGVIEYGWPAKGKQEKPYLRPAVYNNIEAIIRKYEDGISDRIKKYNLN